MGVELIGDSLRVAGIVKQQIADKVGPTVLPFLDIAYGQVQVIPELRIRRKIFIHARHRDFTWNLHILGIRL